MSDFRVFSRVQNGFTLPELVVSMTLMMLLTLAMVASILVWLGQYTIGDARQKQTSNMQTALTRIGDDIRQSHTVLVENIETDANAPTPAGVWATSANQLVLGKTPRNSSGTGLYEVTRYFSGKPDSIVYYLKNGSIYRRTVPANYVGNVTLPLKTCSSDAEGGCAADIRILSDVTQLQFEYYNADNTISVGPSETKSVRVSITTSRQQAGQTVVTTDTLRMSLLDLAKLVPPPTNGGGDPPVVPVTTAGLTTGPGGLQIGMSNITGRDMYIRGPLVTQFMSSINIGNYRMDVANIGCGPRLTYPLTCAPAQPIAITFGSTIAANPICAPGQTTTTGLTGLQAGCTLQPKTLPAFNKDAFTSSMTTTINSDLTCNFFGTQTVAQRTRINGSVTGSLCNSITFGGDAYITGNLTFGNQSVIRVADGVIRAPIIVVNGRVDLSFTRIIANSTGVTPYIISFYSRNITCSNSPSCTSIPNTDLYDTVNDATVAVTLGALSQINASVYAYFGTIQLTMTDMTGSLAAQKLIISNNSRVTLTEGIWPG